MEQGNRLDSTHVSAKQDTTDRGAGDTGRDAAITKMLTSGVKRDAAGRFAKGTKGPSAAPAARKVSATRPAPSAAPRGTIPAPANAPDGAYALTVQGDGLGLHAAPGASLVVAPEMPTGAGLAAFYMKGRTGAVIFDLTHSFRPEYAKPFASGSEVVPLIEVVQPATGRIGGLRADQIEKIHHVFGVYTPVEIAMKHRTAPKALPVMSSCPEGMGEQYVDDAVAYPLVRKGETVVYDPSLRDPVHGALCVLQWNNGTRDVMLTNQRTVGDLEGKWWVDPVNRPANREAGPLYASDGPYEAAHLREKIVGTVVGILGPSRQQDPLPHALHERDRDTAAAFATAVCRDSAAAVGTALTDADLNSKISEEISSAIEDHSEAIAAGRHEPNQRDEAFNRHSARQTETDTVLRNAPVRSLADLRAKLTYLVPLMAPDMLDQTHVAHLTKIRDDVDLLCQRRIAQAEGAHATSDLANACIEQVDRGARWDANPDGLSEEEAEAELDRSGAVFRRAIGERSANPRALAAKAHLMLADINRFHPEDRYQSDDWRLMRVILREVIDMGGLVTGADMAGIRQFDQDADILALGRQFDESHAAWLNSVAADAEPGARYRAAIKAAKASGGPTIDDLRDAHALPGVKEASDAEEAAFGIAAELALDILRRPARAVAALAVQARAVIPHVWATGTYEADAALAPDEDIDKEAVRLLIESCCSAAGVDWRGQVLGHSTTAEGAAASAGGERAAYLARLLAAYAEDRACRPIGGKAAIDSLEELASRRVIRRCRDVYAEILALPPPQTRDGLALTAIAAAIALESMHPEDDDAQAAIALIRATLTFTGVTMPPGFVGFADEPEMDDRDRALYGAQGSLPAWAIAEAQAQRDAAGIAAEA